MLGDEHAIIELVPVKYVGDTTNCNTAVFNQLFNNFSLCLIRSFSSLVQPHQNGSLAESRKKKVALRNLLRNRSEIWEEVYKNACTVGRMASALQVHTSASRNEFLMTALLS